MSEAPANPPRRVERIECCERSAAILSHLADKAQAEVDTSPFPFPGAYNMIRRLRAGAGLFLSVAAHLRVGTSDDSAIDALIDMGLWPSKCAHQEIP